MIEVGSLIKLQRTKQNMTQGDLAKGIVSLSYLSKIENLKTEASPEIIQALCTRLGIQIDNSQNNMILEKCTEWYGMLFEANDKEEIIAKYKEIQELMDENLTENLLMFEIHKIRYYLVIGSYDKAEEKIKQLNDISGTFDNLHLYYWYKFKGNYNTVVNDEHNESMRLYKKAEEKGRQIDVSEEEIADLYYTIGVTHSKLRNTLEAIDYARKALEVFMKEYNFLRCAQCHIILGISYRRIKMYDNAIKNYNLALHLGKLNKNKVLILLAQENLGHLYTTTRESKKAITHFQAVLDDEEAHPADHLYTIASLVGLYYSVGNFEETRNTVNYGLKLLEEFGKYEEYKLYYYIIIAYDHLLKEEYKEFEKLMIHGFLPSLEKQEDYGNIAIYAELLASHFEKFHKYKDATKYYKVANFAYEQITNI
nr:helix-turn-helix domain-containing protein [Virgibacillus sp. YIM 98842]